jgi:hypothetical protein
MTREYCTLILQDTATWATFVFPQKVRVPQEMYAMLIQAAHRKSK